MRGLALFSSKPLRVIFLGTPEVVLPVVQKIHIHSEICELVHVVTQKPSRRGRGAECRDMPSAVHQWALEHSLPVSTPEKAGDPAFLELLRSLNPDVCVTAAYGQYLPRSFLEIPKFGTLNIHPSLLPQFRGASPVQRALQQELSETGVTLLFSTAKMDAGPILAQTQLAIETLDNAATLLPRAFERGALMLLDVLGRFQSGGPDSVCTIEQNDLVASLATKIQAQEAVVSVHRESAHEIVAKMKAFCFWPNVKIPFILKGERTETKILCARAVSLDRVTFEGDLFRANALSLDESLVLPEKLGKVAGEAVFDDRGLWIRCKKGDSVLHVIELQLPGKKAVLASAARNGWPEGKPTLAAD